MYKVKVGSTHSFDLSVRDEVISYQGEPVEIDFKQLPSKDIHILYKNKSYSVEIVEHNAAQKTMSLKINSRIYEVELTDQYDELLHRLGLDKKISNQIKEIKAPMPGLVLKILVAEGQEISKGDNLLILEAMKMENIIKSPVDGTVKAIKVSTGDKLEKNQLMISFLR